MSVPVTHPYDFDPTHGYRLDDLMAVGWPDPPADFAAFWRRRYLAARMIDPAPRIQPASGANPHPDWHIHDLTYQSTDGIEIGGWLLVPRDQPIERGLVIGHGYGGRDQPDFLPYRRTALLFPCFRGLSRSAHPPISTDPAWHVLHDIDQRERYIIGGCVADLWQGVSALLALFPQLEGHVGYSGISLGGGVGALAIPWDGRIQRGHLMLPTFGHYPLRLSLPSVGSLAAVRAYQERCGGDVLETLKYYDAASAARFITIPMLIGAALFDPAVPPPGQFAIYNALRNRKTLFIFDAGHFDYAGQASQNRRHLQQTTDFFATL